MATTSARRTPQNMKPKTTLLLLACFCSLALNAYQQQLTTKHVEGQRGPGNCTQHCAIGLQTAPTMSDKELSRDNAYQDHLARWRDYTVSMNASTYEADYRQLFDDLQVGRLLSCALPCAGVV